ncbi:MAG: basic amino acid ABC transporter substrate-binding protein [Nostoc sp. DedVER02]|uniref:basic amino acid ABC transporter substrate-binding protein n=1 Tax=unclassified Nostoc TaxID=2593658 RepID=UPI002AD5A510|nr:MULTISPECIES: basic amino acid ABC transporter substrate-binding protein [unclassified Nostoc]MDZ7989103.1 basic amino acid ABC transporter substrate-binding protein [Nostoc sp. DedVER02]MDZ8113817.1 basic amino acid ABC transporter substrate-binding protein [Nostoc sp. DedVER01b]
MKLINFKWQQLILSLGCLLLIIGCKNFYSTNNLDAITLKVATDPTFVPFEIQKANGELQGFDIDLINAIGKVASFAVQFESLPFDGMISTLQAKRVDAAISGITITAERLKTIAFSRPYFKAGLAIAVREDNQNIQDFNSLKGKKIAVQIGSTGADFAKTIPNAKISTFNSGPEFFQDLLNGNVDAVVSDAFATLYAIKNGNLKGIKVVADLLTEEYYGIATPKNSPHLDAINKAIGTLLSNGTYKQIYQKWFDAEPPQLPDY